MAVTQTELKSSFLKDIVEEEKYKENIKSIQDWLTSQTQVASSTYQAQAQTAAEQASYDISGAYANYLKQQRNIASQGRLESGYKEEVGDVLQQQYQSVYGQARATQAQNVAGAQASYLKNVQSYQETASKAATSYYESALKEAELRANIYKAAEEYANLEGSQFDVYDIDPKTGRYTLTDWGYEQLSGALLGQEGGFKTYLEEQKLTDELDYYLSDPTGTHKRLFGITETTYDPLSEESLSRRLGAVTTDETGKTISYIDTIEKPTVDIHWSDYGWVDLGESASNKIINTAPQVEQYMAQLGVSSDDLKQATGYSSAEELLKATANAIEKAESGFSPEEIIKSSGFNEAFGKLFVTGILQMFKGFNQGNTQQFARDTYNELMNQIASISKQKYLNKE
jgi:hypothetical protein